MVGTIAEWVLGRPGALLVFIDEWARTLSSGGHWSAGPRVIAVLVYAAIGGVPMAWLGLKQARLRRRRRIEQWFIPSRHNRPPKLPDGWGKLGWPVLGPYVAAFPTLARDLQLRRRARREFGSYERAVAGLLFAQWLWVVWWTLGIGAVQDGPARDAVGGFVWALGARGPAWEYPFVFVLLTPGVAWFMLGAGALAEDNQRLTRRVYGPLAEDEYDPYWQPGLLLAPVLAVGANGTLEDLSARTAVLLLLVYASTLGTRWLWDQQSSTVDPVGVPPAWLAREIVLAGGGDLAAVQAEPDAPAPVSRERAMSWRRDGAPTPPDAPTGPPTVLVTAAATRKDVHVTAPDPVPTRVTPSHASEAAVTAHVVVERTRQMVGEPTRETTATTPSAELLQAWSTTGPPMQPLRAGDPASIGRMALQGRIGSGGFGVVYATVPAPGSRPLAVKRIHPHLLDEPDLRERFVREGQALERVHGPGVARIRHVGVEDEVPYLVMDLLEGRSLGAHPSRQSLFHQCAHLELLAREVATGLATCHRAGVVHRDVKPANIILTEAGAYVIDLGIALVQDASRRLTATGGFLGTQGFTAPEVIHGTTATPASDVWAWACTMVAAVTGRSPYHRDTPSAAMLAVATGAVDTDALAQLETISPAVAATVRAALAMEPTDRPATGSDLLTFLPR